LFAISIAAFGIENLICARSSDPFLPVIPWVPSYSWLAYFTGLTLIATSVCIAAKIRARVAALLLGILFFCAIWSFRYPELPRSHGMWGRELALLKH